MSIFNDKRIAARKLTSREVTIGRTHNNDIAIDNPGVSAALAVIRAEGEDFSIEDVGSKNGTYVNGRRITLHKLEYGDIITIFKHRLEFVPKVAEGDSDPASDRAGLIDHSGTIQVDASRITVEHQASCSQAAPRTPLESPCTGGSRRVRTQSEKTYSDRRAGTLR